MSGLSSRDWPRLESGERAGKRWAAHVQEVGHILAGFAFIDQLSRVVDLLWCELHLPAKLHASPLRAIHVARVRSEISDLSSSARTPIIAPWRGR